MRLDEITNELYDVIVASKLGRFADYKNLPYDEAKQALNRVVGDYQSDMFKANPRATAQWNEDGKSAKIVDSERDVEIFFYLAPKGSNDLTKRERALSIEEGEGKIWTWKDYIYDVGDIVYARNPQTHKIVQVVIRDGGSSYMDFQYKVEYRGDPIGYGNGGLWGANNEDLYKTKEEGEIAQFNKKLGNKQRSAEDITEITASEFKDKLKDPGKAKIEAWINEIRETTPKEWILDYDVRDPVLDFGDYELMFRYEGDRNNLQYEMQEMIYAIHDVIGDKVLEIDRYPDDGIVVTSVEI